LLTDQHFAQDGASQALLSPNFSATSQWTLACILRSALGSRNFMTLKIDRARARIRLSGKLRFEHLDQIKAEIELCESPAVLDLEELELIDVEAVRFLNTCEEKGVSVLHCSPYISKWMLRERILPEARTEENKTKGVGEFGE
jgi:hypothetical protein